VAVLISTVGIGRAERERGCAWRGLLKMPRQGYPEVTPDTVLAFQKPSEGKARCKSFTAAVWIQGFVM
jgi:hypothetical protein